MVLWVCVFLILWVKEYSWLSCSGITSLQSRWTKFSTGGWAGEESASKLILDVGRIWGPSLAGLSWAPPQVLKTTQFLTVCGQPTGPFTSPSLQNSLCSVLRCKVIYRSSQDKWSIFWHKAFPKFSLLEPAHFSMGQQSRSGQDVAPHSHRHKVAVTGDGPSPLPHSMAGNQSQDPTHTLVSGTTQRPESRRQRSWGHLWVNLLFPHKCLPHHVFKANLLQSLVLGSSLSPCQPESDPAPWTINWTICSASSW